MLAASWAIGCSVMLPGCDTGQPTREPEIVGELPTYADLAARYNARLNHLDRLQAPVSVVIETVNEDGDKSRDQLEGNLSVSPPRDVALRLDKAGQNAAYLGSNDRMYWWMALAEKPRWMAAGTHLKARPNDTEEFGLPVHPLEFVELLGVLPLPTAAPAPSTNAVTVTSDRRSFVVALPSRWGTRRFTLDPATAQPRRIELLAGDGAVVATADLSRYVPVSIEGNPGASVRVASNISVTVPESAMRIILVVSEPKGPLKINPRAFDMVELVKAYNIGRLIDLDARKPAPAGSASPNPGRRTP